MQGIPSEGWASGAAGARGRETSPHPAAPPGHRHPVPRHRLHHPRERDARPRRGGGSPPAEPFRAQVVGVQWIESPRAPGLPDRRQLLWVQGWLSPTRMTTRSRRNRRCSLASVLWPPSSPRIRPQPFEETFGLYVFDLIRPSAPPYALYDTYFYTVQPKNPSAGANWPGSGSTGDPRHAPAAARRLPRRVRTAPGPLCLLPRPDPCPPPTSPPTSRLTVGFSASAGFHSSPRRWTAWRPDKERVGDELGCARLPNDKSIAENCTLLILAARASTPGGAYRLIARPAVRSVKPTPNPPRAVPAPPRPGTTRCGWRRIRPVEPARIGRVIHDAGSGAASP